MKTCLYIYQDKANIFLYFHIYHVSEFSPTAFHMTNVGICVRSRAFAHVFVHFHICCLAQGFSPTAFHMTNVGICVRSHAFAYAFVHFYTRCLAQGFSPTAFHMTNVGMHAFACVLVYALAVPMCGCVYVCMHMCVCVCVCIGGRDLFKLVEWMYEVLRMLSNRC